MVVQLELPLSAACFPARRQSRTSKRRPGLHSSTARCSPAWTRSTQSPRRSWSPPTPPPPPPPQRCPYALLPAVQAPWFPSSQRLNLPLGQMRPDRLSGFKQGICMGALTLNHAVRLQPGNRVYVTLASYQGRMTCRGAWALPLLTRDCVCA